MGAEKCIVYFMKTCGEKELALAEGIRGIQREFLGCDPPTRVYLLDDLLLVRMTGVVTLLRRQQMRTTSLEGTRDLLKKHRTALIESARVLMEELIVRVSGQQVESMHHDISTRTGEEVLMFVLSTSSRVRRADGN